MGGHPEFEEDRSPSGPQIASFGLGKLKYHRQLRNIYEMAFTCVLVNLRQLTWKISFILPSSIYITSYNLCNNVREKNSRF